MWYHLLPSRNVTGRYVTYTFLANTKGSFGPWFWMSKVFKSLLFWRFFTALLLAKKGNLNFPPTLLISYSLLWEPDPTPDCVNAWMTLRNYPAVHWAFWIGKTKPENTFAKKGTPLLCHFANFRGCLHRLPALSEIAANHQWNVNAVFVGTVHCWSFSKMTQKLFAMVIKFFWHLFISTSNAF